MILAALAILAAQPAPPEAPPAAWTQGDWVPLTEDEGVRMDYDQSALRLEGDKLRIRVRAALPEPAAMRWATSEWELDCRARSYRMLATAEYGDDGALLGRSSEPDPAATESGSESGRANIDLVCRRAGWRPAGGQ